MKKVIIALAISGFISLGFTLIKEAPKSTQVSKTETSEKMDFSHKLDEKRLASWD
jgi:hypothetical protein